MGVAELAAAAAAAAADAAPGTHEVGGGGVDEENVTCVNLSDV